MFHSVVPLFVRPFRCFYVFLLIVCFCPLSATLPLFVLRRSLGICVGFVVCVDWFYRGTGLYFDVLSVVAIFSLWVVGMLGDLLEYLVARFRLCSLLGGVGSGVVAWFVGFGVGVAPGVGLVGGHGIGLWFGSRLGSAFGGVGFW